MSGSAPGNQPSPGRSDVYWRRRVIALAAGISLVGLVAWTVNGALGGGAARQSAQVSGLTPTSTRSPAPAASLAAAGRTPSAAPTPAATGSASAPPRAPHKSARPAATAAAGHPALSGPACRHRDIVLSLFAARYSYPARGIPQFQVDVVSTAPGTCVFSLGAGNVQLLVKAGGIHRVWDSADCARPAAGAVRLARGIPAVLKFSWDRKTSAPGCRLPRRAVRPGTYTATAYSGRARSQSLIFVLRAPGIGVP